MSNLDLERLFNRELVQQLSRCLAGNFLDGRL
jgi:hypothetical protein